MKPMPLNHKKLFYLLSCIIAGLLAWLSVHAPLRFDWTGNQQHHLAAETMQQLAQIVEPIQIISYATPNPEIRRYIRALINKFQAQKDNITFEFINPELQPEQTRALHIERDGELIIKLKHKTRKLSIIREANLIQTIINMHQTEKLWIGYLSGHGERNPYAQSKADLSVLHQTLKKNGLFAISLNPARLKKIPDNISLLIIASPTQPYAHADIQQILAYLSRGGNLLWLTEPGADALTALNDVLQLQFLPGQAIDMNARAYKTQSAQVAPPTFCFIRRYPTPSIVNNTQVALLPNARALTWQANWQAILTTEANSWTETQQITGNIRFDATQGETAGPLVIGAALEQVTADQQQKIVVIGDGDFLSNRYIGTGANLEVATQLLQWLIPKQEIPFSNPIGPQHQLQLTERAAAVMAIIFFATIPSGLGLTGLLIWRRRRHL